jgi:hypothetical protein
MQVISLVMQYKKVLEQEIVWRTCNS